MPNGSIIITELFMVVWGSSGDTSKRLQSDGLELPQSFRGVWVSRWAPRSQGLFDRDYRFWPCTLKNMG